METAMEVATETEVEPARTKDWTFYTTDKTTVIMRELPDGRVAITRAFLSAKDRFVKKKGRNVALSRMRCFMEEHYRSGLDFYDTNRRIKGKNKHRSGLWEYTIFEVLPPEEIMDNEEYDFWEGVISKKRTPVVKGVSEPEPVAYI